LSLNIGRCRLNEIAEIQAVWIQL